MTSSTPRTATALGLTAAVAFAGFAVSATADDFPSRPIEYIIPFNPGGESDVTARMQEPHLEERFGVSVNVRHQPGGGGAVGWSEFQNNAEPDGHEIIGINIPHIVGQPLQREDAGYETDGFEIVTWFHFTPNTLIVPADSPFETVDDLVEFAADNPQSLTIGGSGTYSGNHLEVLRLEEVADIELTYIPFTGTGPLPAAILGGHVGALMTNSMLGVQMEGDIRTLAVASEERVPALPDVPTFKELGYDIVGGTYRGIAVPTGTPQERIDKLAEAFSEINEIIGEEQVPLGFIMTNYTGDEAWRIVEQVRDNYADFLVGSED